MPCFHNKASRTGFRPFQHWRTQSYPFELGKSFLTVRLQFFSMWSRKKFSKKFLTVFSARFYSIAPVVLFIKSCSGIKKCHFFTTTQAGQVFVLFSIEEPNHTLLNCESHLELSGFNVLLWAHEKKLFWQQCQPIFSCNSSWNPEKIPLGAPKKCFF